VTVVKPIVLLIAWLVLLIVPSGVLWATGTADAADTARADANNTVTYEECTIGDGAVTMLADCVSISVPIDRANPSLGTIDLAVARIQSRSNNPKPDPFTLIAGGPGQSAAGSFPSVARAFRHIRQDRDIILIDQRGTGESNRLDCPPNSDDTDAFSFDAERIRKLSRECVESLTTDPRFYTTSVAVVDLDDVRQRLGFEQWNIYGVSYGTRVAQHYVKRFPKRTRSLILDAVVPMTRAALPHFRELLNVRKRLCNN